MKVSYRNCEIEAYREKSLGGDTILYYSVFTDDGAELISDFSEGTDTIRECVKDLKSMVDKYRDIYKSDFDKWLDEE